jgi:hypothetical protein
MHATELADALFARIQSSHATAESAGELLAHTHRRPYVLRRRIVERLTSPACAPFMAARIEDAEVIVTSSEGIARLIVARVRAGCASPPTWPQACRDGPAPR